MSDAPRVFSATTGRVGRAPSQIELLAESVSAEELAKRRADQRKHELLDAGRRGFDITVRPDFDWETFAPWVVPGER